MAYMIFGLFSLIQLTNTGPTEVGAMIKTRTLFATLDQRTNIRTNVCVCVCLSLFGDYRGSILLSRAKTSEEG